MKLLELQKKVEAIKKESVNSYFKSKYFDINKLLEAIKPTLNELDLVLVQPIRVIDGKNVLTSKLIDGDKVLLESEMIIPDLQDPQKVGSVISYYRRYAIQSMLLLEAEDTDGDIGQNKPKVTF